MEQQHYYVFECIFVKYEPTGPHEVDFVISIVGTNYKMSCPNRGGGGRLLERGGLIGLLLYLRN